MKVSKIILCCLMISFMNHSINATTKNNPPNVILILTDDLGIGDLGCMGNPWLKTPNIDAFYEEAIRLTDFHVSPLCTPTRAAIVTGKYPINNGAWATFKGRDMLTENTFNIAEAFKSNGYKTGLFGKWHLGDNYPLRPTDMGFDTAVHHLAGGVGELSDYWGNSYFNDVYYRNNKPEQFEGYCTDVWFKETIDFIEENKESPFFVYLPTNAPHDPLIVDEKYAKPYRALEGEKIISANLYGMIANIDENFGKFYQYLADKKLLDNTILIFMSDNGTRFGYSNDGTLGYNKGYKGIKGSKQEGGHRVPFFIRWPGGGISGGKDVETLTAHVDLIPTLANLCDLEVPSKVSFDGIDFSNVLTNQKDKNASRIAYVHHRQDWRQPKDVDQTCIMKNEWRLINGEKLYNIEKDPKQTNNLADNYPELMDEMLTENARFLKKTKQNSEYSELPTQVIGNDQQAQIKLTIQHAIGEDGGIWKCEQVAAGVKNKNNTHALRIEREGLYEIQLRRWPLECRGPIWGIPNVNPKGLFKYETIQPEKAILKVQNQIHEKKIHNTDEAVTFKVRLSIGKTFLVNDFIEGKSKYGVYYTYVKYLGKK